MPICHTSRSKATTNKVLMVAAYNTYIPHASVSGYTGGSFTEIIVNPVVHPLKLRPFANLQIATAAHYIRVSAVSPAASRAAVRERRS